MNRTGSAAPQRSQRTDLQIRVCSGFLVLNVQSHTIFLYEVYSFPKLSCSLRWISVFRAAVQLCSVLCCSGSVGPGPAHLAVRLIMSDMITTELAAVYFHIYPEAANWIWLSAKRRLLIELMRLGCSRLENQLTKTKNKNRFWSSFRKEKWVLFSVVQGTMFSSSSLISLWVFSSKHVQREFFI